MNIGIVGAGKMGFGMGSLWAEKGHQVCFSYSRCPARLEATVMAAGANATLSTPAGAAQFGQVVLLAVHWPQAPQLLGDIHPYLADKPLLTCVVPWNAGHNGLCLGIDNSAAEEIARMAPEASVVEALPLLVEALYAPARLLDLERATVFYCGNDTAAKEMVAPLLEALDMETQDAGDLTSARLLEPAAALLWQLAVGMGEGPDIALKLLRR